MQKEAIIRRFPKPEHFISKTSFSLSSELTSACNSCKFADKNVLKVLFFVELDFAIC